MSYFISFHKNQHYTQHLCVQTFRCTVPLDMDILHNLPLIGNNAINNLIRRLLDICIGQLGR